MASFGSLIDRLPAILEKITKHNADVLSGATDSPNGKKTQNILVNSPTIRELSAVKAVNQAVKTPGGFELTPHAKPRRVDLEDLLWVRALHVTLPIRQSFLSLIYVYIYSLFISLHGFIVVTM